MFKKSLTEKIITPVKHKYSIKNKTKKQVPVRKAQSIDQRRVYIDKRLNTILNRGKKHIRGKSQFSTRQNKKIVIPQLIKKNTKKVKSIAGFSNKQKTTSSLESLILPQTPSNLPIIPNMNTASKLRRDKSKSSNSLKKMKRCIRLKNGLTDAKGVYLQKAKSSKFGLSDYSAVYAVNTTNGILRNYNEDRVSIVINIKKKPNWKDKRWPVCSYFAIFDGHGGSLCADYLKDNLHTFILENSNFPLDVPQAIREGCQRAETEFCAFALKQTNVDRSGSCAIIVIIIDNVAYVGNIGDSRAIVSEKKGLIIRELSKDHKPEDPKEQERIIKNGGQVSKSLMPFNFSTNADMMNQMPNLPYRIYPGGLSVSRSFGDVTAKNTNYNGNPNVLIATPDIRLYKIDEMKTDFIFIGCKLIRRWHL